MYCSTTSYDKYIDILAQMTTSDSWLKRAESSKCCCKNIHVYSFKYKDELKTNCKFVYSWLWHKKEFVPMFSVQYLLQSASFSNLLSLPRQPP